MRVCIYPTNTFLPANGFLPSMSMVKNASVQVWISIRPCRCTLDTRHADNGLRKCKTTVIGGTVRVFLI